jgi:hypothetical protein
MTAILRSPNEVPTQADHVGRKLEPALFVRLKTFGAKTAGAIKTYSTRALIDYWNKTKS